MIQEGSQEYKDACELWELFESQKKGMLGNASVAEMEERFGFFLSFFQTDKNSIVRNISVIRLTVIRNEFQYIKSGCFNI